MKKIYIVLTYTGTVLSKIVKIYTKYKYSHVSISLDKNLNEMYSFGRLNPYNPFKGGFVHEGIHHGTFKRFHKTISKIYSIEVTDEQYENVKEIILDMDKEKQKYKFNIWGLFAVSLNIKIRKQNYFYCAEFVKYVFEQAKINNDLPELIRPEHFMNIPGAQEIYEGQLKLYGCK